jgi:NAD(P)H-hydrate epimerase
MDRTQFYTSTGVRVPAVTAEEMRAVDRVAVEDVGLELLQMMENAGRSLASHVLEYGSESVLVLAGNGGNGGGGLACARHLANHQVPVRVLVDRDPSELTGAAATQHRILASMDVPVDSGEPTLQRHSDAGVVIDALIGYGLSGAVRGTARQLVDALDRQASPVVSLDVPSGVDATTGDALGSAVTPERVVTLALPKTGLTAVSAELFLADIGIPRIVYDRLDIDYAPPFRRDEWIEPLGEENVTG